MPTEQAYDRTSPIGRGEPKARSLSNTVNEVAKGPLEVARWSFDFAKQAITGKPSPHRVPIKPLTTAAIYAGLASASYFLWRRSL